MGGRLHLWFVWSDPELSPGEDFRIVGGDALSRTVIEKASHEGEMYELRRVKARFTKYFNTTRYPLDNHLLTIHIEDSRHDVSRLRFVPDTEGSAISSRVKIPGFEHDAFEIVSKRHPYKTSLGDPRRSPQQQDVYSQLIFGVPVQRPGWGVFLKMFQALFAAVLVALLALAVLPTNNPRFGLGVGAFFASIATTYVTNRQLPDAGLLTMTDVINGLGMGTIFLTLIHSAIALHLQQGGVDEAKLRRFDKIGLTVFGAGYIGANAVIALSAA